jgi:hypothetical protein
LDQKQRHKRLRLLVHKLNHERKRQARKIDILCNQFISAQRDFIQRLNTICFTANFYEAIVGTRDLTGLLRAACRLIKDEIPDVNMAFFLRQAGGFKSHLFDDRDPQKLAYGNAGSSQPTGFGKQYLENYFAPELVNSICESNKVCTLDDMFAMGLQGSTGGLNKISAVTVPLGLFGSSLGFMLIYRPSQNKITAADLHNISAIIPGLSRAIQSCHVPLHAAD